MITDASGGAAKWELRRAHPPDGPSDAIGVVDGQRLPLAPRFHPHFDLSPEGRWLAVPLTDGDTTNLWALPTDGRFAVAGHRFRRLRGHDCPLDVLVDGWPVALCGSRGSRSGRRDRRRRPVIVNLQSSMSPSSGALKQNQVVFVDGPLRRVGPQPGDFHDELE